MQYRGKAIEVLGEKVVLGKTVSWIRILENGAFMQVSKNDIEVANVRFTQPLIRFTALAAKIQDEISKKKLLAPYESTLLPLPHQVLVLEKVMQSDQNRFLLADEVGMGKTIETGLILKELKLRDEIKRILVIVPKSSMLQWQSELKEHFNEVFHIYDSEIISALTKTFSALNGDNAFNFWEQHNQIIVSTDALKPLEKRQGWSQEKVDEYNRYRMEAVLNANFDAVIIDEAHKMGGASQTVSRYILAQSLCNIVPNVFLLSATPHRGKSDHFRRILQLLDPDAFEGEGLPSINELQPYVIRTEKRLALDYEGQKLFNERETIKLSIELDLNRHFKQIDLYRSVTEYVIKVFNSSKRSGNSATGLIMILFQRLASSSTAAILSAMDRRLERLKNGEIPSVDDLVADIDSDELEDTAFDFEDLHFYEKEGIDDEITVLEELVSKAKSTLASELDAKAEYLIAKFKQIQQEETPDTKFLVFTEFKTTQRMLVDILERKGFTCTSINGSQDLDTRKEALLSFKNEKQILVATDAAGESLNMQFCNIVVNYDMPWNPMMIEQRIGRVDRIGQKKKVRAFNMLTNNSVDQRVYEVIETKLNNILNQLGIDKSSDVLDSTIDLKKLNKLYLQSLLDPERFEHSGDRWLHDIKLKLKDYQSTEGVLPIVKESELSYQDASEIKHSPIPIWIEEMIKQFVLSQRGSYKKSLLNFAEIELDGLKKRITSDPEIALMDPGIEQVTIQTPWLKEIFFSIGGNSDHNKAPVLRMKESNTTSGIWSLWEVTAKNNFDQKISYQAFFVSDTGKSFPAFANEIWNKLLSESEEFEFVHDKEYRLEVDSEELFKNSLKTHFDSLEAQLLSLIEKKKANRHKAYEYQKKRLDNIGIENIKRSRLNKLEEEYQDWLKTIQLNSKVVPGIKQLITFRLDA
jgi:superfamily II DNA or RNA helicase